MGHYPGYFTFMDIKTAKIVKTTQRFASDIYSMEISKDSNQVFFIDDISHLYSAEWTLKNDSEIS